MKVCYRDLSSCGSHLRDWQIIQDSIPGFELVKRIWDADVAIIYLCGLSKKAIDEVEREIEDVDYAFSRNPNLKVFVGGCAADLVSVQTLLGKYNLTKNLFTKSTMANVVLGELGFRPSRETIPYIDHRYTAVVNIAIGCRRHCAFCKTWYLDMEYRSVPKSVILKEIGEAVSRGVFHICLTAENSTEYGSDLEKDGKGHLGELLREIFQTYPDIKIMDVMGVCLDEVDDSLADYFLEEKRINEVQMEIQSFIPEVRKKMLLEKSAEEAKALYAKLRARKIVRANIITGHPGEGSANFNSQLDYILANAETCWSLDISPLDSTPGTQSYKMEQVKKDIAEANQAKLQEAIKKMRKAWATKVLELNEPLHACAVTYAYDLGKKEDQTLCMVWGQPVVIIVKGHLPLYENYRIRPTAYLRDGDDNHIVMSGIIYK